MGAFEERIITGEYVGNDEEEENEVVVYDTVLWVGANGDRLSNGDDPVHPACRARSSSSITSASLMFSDDLNCD